MAGRDYRNILVCGGSGSGKSHFVDNELLPAMLPRTRYAVAVNTTEELSQHFTHREYVGEEQQKKTYSEEAIADLIRHHKRVHFEVAAGENCTQFLETLGRALWTLGVYNTEFTEVLVVFDETHLFLPKRAMPKSFARLETEGRKFGFDILKITQTLQSATGDTLSHLAIKQVNVVIVFNLTDFNDRKRIQALFPSLPDPGEFARPDDGGAPEYAVRDSKSGKNAVIRRDGHGGRVAIAA
ncbi:hypothetical protein E7T09_04510 [Deinococcus sp. KSM4-11]|uniref:ATP-binding protein n=1 Tax=Deinococcus sp. KSM4-11 TaxID=2568654 RepID=UPI0010A3A2AD|nr:ATP-binding protein [Deinococcus sp. KSM4-11]THF88473.1 hypothetical protein E7T09_04510 [Deinococcus sp. KSM4-11]